MSSISVMISTLGLILNFMCIALAFDASPLQDFCVADSTGKACKDPNTVTPNDFFLSGLHLPGNTSNPYGAAVAVASAATVPGLNSLGLTFMRADLAPNGFFPPHYHSRATELVVVLEGSMEVGFITSYPQYKYYSKILQEGDVFVVPVGLVHNVRNVAKGNTVALVAFNSQNPGITNLPNGIFAAKPAVDSVYLSKAFQLDVNTIVQLQKKFYM
ncbi:putative germin-like protein 2-1 [Salvia miltiorrhiza]|uniref:putative germin-like protein 2-1 n=1 Tax=Salvia miltiorrhiza TaxID=226208 RepID=UPI0025AC52A0|nr:putative germin-like protein 2-1 [Salvia miltiorrhiza]